MPKQNAIFETPLEKLGRVLSEQYHVDVVLEGERAYTDGKKIVLPALANLSEEVAEKMGVLLDHEVAHLRSSTLNLVPSTPKTLEEQLVVALEDCRVEHRMAEIFPGTRLGFRRVWTQLREERRGAPLATRIIDAICDEGRGTVGVLEEEVAGYIKAVRHLVHLATESKDTSAVVDYASQIAQILRLVETQPPAQGCGGEKEEDGVVGQEQAGQEGAEPGQGGQEGGEERNGEVQEGASPGESAGKGEARGARGLEGKANAAPGKESLKSAAKAEPSRKAKGERGEKSVSEIFSHMSSGIDFASAINALVRRDPETGYATGRIPLLPSTTKYDVVRDYTKHSRGAYRHIKEEVLPMVRPVERGLERIFKVYENARTAIEQEEGKLSGRSMTKLMTQPGTRRVFQRYVKTETPRVAVEILVDLSGSMCGRIYAAQRTTAALAEALTRLGMAVEVTGFWCEYSQEMERMAGRAASTKYIRFSERAEYSLFKTFEDKSCHGIASMRSGYNNHDGEALLWAARRLAARREKRKILLVLSDGAPLAGDHSQSVLGGHLRLAVGAVLKSGIECVGVGIQTDAVKSYYPDWVVVRKLESLPAVVLGKLAELLKPDRKKKRNRTVETS